MRIKSLLAAAVLAITPAVVTLPALAHDGIHVEDAYARVMGANAKSGAAFMELVNHGAKDDRLIKAASDVAERVELHTHIADAQGNMKMVEVKEGFVVPAGGHHMLERGGDHVMFLGLTRSLSHGDVITVTLTFEREGDMVVEIPVDLERKPQAGAHGHGHGHMHGQAPKN